ncbi:hypothetical protein [Streptomyces sp. NPDC085466]|uniref:hypothetical protein n=1 Tax=Streptomyces sp. NPDC085466 TaxID=3365725 RepID=UPI0037D23078
MRVVRASLEGRRPDPADPTAPAPAPPPATPAVLALLSDLVWAHAAPRNGLEHVRARATDDGVDVYLFLRAPSEDAALDQARAILADARTPLRTHGYTTAPPRL